MTPRWTAALTVAALLAGASSAAAADTAPEKKAAESAGRTWLSLVDAGKYGESWKAASRTFRDAVPEARWVEMVGGVRRDTGKLQGRELASASYTEALPGAAGTFVVLQFRSRFEKLGDGTETVTMQQEGKGTWRLAGYFVRPGSPDAPAKGG